MFSAKQVRKLNITVMVMVRVQCCVVNDGFWIQRETPSWTRDPAGNILAPRDPSDPATLPILRRTAATAAPPIRLSPRRSFPIPSGQGGEKGGGWVAHQRTCAHAAVSVSYPILFAESRSPGPRRPRRAATASSETCQ